MSTLLPIVEKERDIVAALLREQQSLTAVEKFSRTHDAVLTHLPTQERPAQERYYRELMPATSPGPNQQFAFEVDLDSCSGCKACVVACHTLNGLDEHETWRSVGTLFGEDTVQHVTTACHHCEDLGCLNGCPVKAYVKDEVTGIVRHLDDQCIGCKYCIMMCPYEVPQYSERLGIVRKCDMCQQRLNVGEAPACVQSCPNEAIKIRIVDHSDARFEYDSLSCIAPGAPVSSITRPTTTYRTKDQQAFQRAVPQDTQVDSVAESHWPLAVLLVATQAAIGMIIAERFASLGFMVLGDSMPLAVTRLVATIALLVAGVGMNLAPLHLGQPLRAWRVFLGLGTSWLSREAIVLGGFMGLLSASVALLWLPVVSDDIPEFVLSLAPSWAAKASLGLSLVTGLVGFYCSGMIYIATRRKLWRFSRTMTRFGGSMCVLGLVGFAFAASISASSMRLAVAASVLALLVMALKLVYETVTHYVPRTVLTLDDLDLRSERLVLGPLRPWFIGRLTCGVIGSLMVLAVIAGMPWSVSVGCLALAFVLLVLGEFAERYLYFASVVYDRMPGTLK